jgi:hypothetical protein
MPCLINISIDTREHSSHIITCAGSHLRAIAPTYTAPCLTCDLYMKLTPFHAKQPKNITLPLRRRSTCVQCQLVTQTHTHTHINTHIQTNTHTHTQTHTQTQTSHARRHTNTTHNQPQPPHSTAPIFTRTASLLSIFPNTCCSPAISTETGFLFALL